MAEAVRNFLPGRLKYVKGDATVPQTGAHRMIVHICNVDGGWGAGFVLALSKRWKKPEEEYRRWYRNQTNFKFGEVQEITVQSDISVVNMLAMSYDKAGPDGIPVRYDALKNCLKKVATLAKENNSSIHMPRIGCGLGGASWEMVEKIIIEELVSKGVNVTIYDLPSVDESKES